MILDYGSRYFCGCVRIGINQNLVRGRIEYGLGFGRDFFRGLLWIGIYCSFLGICVGFILEIKGF